MTHAVVPHDDWIEARKALLAEEKAFTRARDELSRRRRELPWEEVEKDYVFEGSRGRETLADLFDGRSQLVVYHFMFEPDVDEGCPSCSFWADNFDRNVVHLNHRDVSFIAVSRAPYELLQIYDRFSLYFCIRDGEEAEVQGYRFEPVAPWHVRLDPFPFVESPARFSLLRRVVPKGRAEELLAVEPERVDVLVSA